jgi:hypothetical protein
MITLLATLPDNDNVILSFLYQYGGNQLPHFFILLLNITQLTNSLFKNRRNNTNYVEEEK